VIAHLLEEYDVYSSPYMYTTIDGERREILLVGYDYYEKSWRCEYEYAIKDNTGQFYGFHNCFIEKYKADSIVDIWLNKNWQLGVMNIISQVYWCKKEFIYFAIRKLQNWLKQLLYHS